MPHQICSALAKVQCISIKTAMSEKNVLSSGTHCFSSDAQSTATPPATQHHSKALLHGDVSRHEDPSRHETVPRHGRRQSCSMQRWPDNLHPLHRQLRHRMTRPWQAPAIHIYINTWRVFKRPSKASPTSATSLDDRSPPAKAYQTTRVRLPANIRQYRQP